MNGVRLTNEERIHAICQIIREESDRGDCAKCPSQIDSPYGPGTQGCYLLAQELFNIAAHGKPRGVAPGMTTQTFSYVETCTEEELSLSSIRERAEGFNYFFEKNGGYKGYEAQAIDVLLAEIDRLNTKLRPENREPPHCSTCACGLPRKPEADCPRCRGIGVVIEQVTNDTGVGISCPDCSPARNIP